MTTDPSDRQLRGPTTTDAEPAVLFSSDFEPTASDLLSDLKGLLRHDAEYRTLDDMRQLFTTVGDLLRLMPSLLHQTATDFSAWVDDGTSSSGLACNSELAAAAVSAYTAEVNTALDEASLALERVRSIIAP